MKFNALPFRKTLATLAAASVLLATGCGGGTGGSPADASSIDLSSIGTSSEAQQAMADLYKAALDNGENELTIYGTQHKTRQAVYDRFEKQFPGIKTSTSELVGAQMHATLEAEKTSGNHAGDILQNPNGGRYARAGFGEPYSPASFVMPTGINEKLATQLQGNDKMFTVPDIPIFGIGINTAKISADEAPKTWQELGDPKWKGKVVLHDPSVPGGGQGVMSLARLSGAVDDTLLRKIAENVAIKGDYGQTLQSLAQGEYPVLLAASSAGIDQLAKQGAKVEFLLLDEDNVALTDKWVLLKDAPHPNAAKLFLNYLHTTVGQQAFADTGALTLSQDVTSSMGLPSLGDANLADLPTEEEQDAASQENQALFTEIFRGRAQ